MKKHLLISALTLAFLMGGTGLVMADEMRAPAYPPGNSEQSYRQEHQGQLEPRQNMEQRMDSQRDGMRNDMQQRTDERRDTFR